MDSPTNLPGPDGEEEEDGDAPSAVRLRLEEVMKMKQTADNSVLLLIILAADRGKGRAGMT